MDRITFEAILKKGIHKLKYRDQLVTACLKNPSWIAILLDEMNTTDNPNSTFSARIFELSCKENFEIILPFLDTFCNLLSSITFEGVIRPCAKICELLMLEYFVKKTVGFVNLLSDKHFEKIIEAGFDWMITNKATAIQAYTMQTLFLLGTKYDWIHIELALLIEKGIPTGSTGYKNRGRKVLKAIATNTTLKL